MTKETLEQLYAEHSGKVSDKWAIYLVEYGRIFGEYRNKPITLLEIGIQNGGSLEIWSKFFTNAQKLVGCDINPDCARLVYKDPRVAVVVGDANSDAVQSIVLQHAPVFDVIIDDGSHRSSDIVKSFAKYFPNLADGGVFVAEDLHCSYWQEFEGGLFDPFSSITFFKRLADVVSHEHWGIKKARVDILRGFFSKYDFQIDEDVLQHIHSVEFINSMCVIRKGNPEHNRLGTRFIAGSVEMVVPGHVQLDSSLNKAPNQNDNEWSARNIPPDEELPLRLKQIDNLNQAIVDRDRQIAALYTSASWRLTWPLRTLANQVKRPRNVTKRIVSNIKRSGGLKNTLKKVLRLYRLEGFSGIKRGLKIATTSVQIKPSMGSGEFDRNDYAEWIQRYDIITDVKRVAMRVRIDAFVHKPLISVVMPTYNPKPEWLSEAIESLCKQIYPHWELCVADDASTDKAIRPILERYAREDSRIKVVFREQNGHISAASNSALELASGEWVALLDHDDLLPEHALFWVVDAINRNPETRLIYSDEDKIDENGIRSAPYFKCDWNVDLFYAQNMFSHLGVYHTALLHEVGGFRLGMEGSQDYDLALRCIEHIESRQIHHIPRVLYHWRMHAESTAKSGNAKPYAMLAGEKALNEHFSRQGVNAKVGFIGHGYRVRYILPAPLPLVSLIISSRKGLHLIKQCVESILKKTTYANYEILIIDNGSDNAAAIKCVEKLEAEPRVRALRYAHSPNYAELNNAAAKMARGELLALINSDVSVISPDWLSEMVSLALQPNVGAVGARLWNPNETLKHGGAVLGMGWSGVAGLSQHNMPRYQHGYFGRGNLIQSFSAVKADCLVVRKDIYEEVGGLDETNLQMAFNDVDFCLRVREAGYRNVWTPFAELYHHESVTSGLEDATEKQVRFVNEVAYMKERWGKQLIKDPAYSPNLTLRDEDFSLAWPPRVDLPTS